MREFKRSLVLCFIFMVVMLIVYLFRPGGEEAVVTVSNIAATAAGLIGFLALAWLLLDAKQLEVAHRANKWLFFCLGMLLYFLGEATWMIYEVILGLDPYPSIADVFWLAGYVPLFVGLIYTIRETKVGFWSSKTPLTCMAAAAFAAVSYVYLLQPILADTGTSLVERSTNLAYPLLDLGLIVLAATVLIFYQKGVLGKPWLFVLVGFVMFGIGDSLFTYFSWTGDYHNVPYYDMIDLLWLGGYWSIALGAIYEKSFQDRFLKAERQTGAAGRMAVNH